MRRKRKNGMREEQTRLKKAIKKKWKDKREDLLEGVKGRRTKPSKVQKWLLLGELNSISS